MRTEQSTKCFVPLQKLRMRLCMYFQSFQGGSFVVVLCCVFFGVRVSVTFHLTPYVCVHIIFSSVSVTKWPPFGK